MFLSSYGTSSCHSKGELKLPEAPHHQAALEGVHSRCEGALRAPRVFCRKLRELTRARDAFFNKKAQRSAENHPKKSSKFRTTRKTIRKTQTNPVFFAQVQLPYRNPFQKPPKTSRQTRAGGSFQVRWR